MEIYICCTRSHIYHGVVILSGPPLFKSSDSATAQSPCMPVSRLPVLRWPHIFALSCWYSRATQASYSSCHNWWQTRHHPSIIITEIGGRSSKWCSNNSHHTAAARPVHDRSIRRLFETLIHQKRQSVLGGPSSTEESSKALWLGHPAIIH